MVFAEVNWENLGLFHDHVPMVFFNNAWLKKECKIDSHCPYKVSLCVSVRPRHMQWLCAAFGLPCFSISPPRNTRYKECQAQTAQVSCSMLIINAVRNDPRD